MATNLGFTTRVRSFEELVFGAEGPEDLLRSFSVLFVAPGLSQQDYGFLRQIASPGGILDQFVWLGGLAVINVAGTTTMEQGLTPRDPGPGGITYRGAVSHNSETIALPAHPYITGAGYGGHNLTPTDFDAWNHTDRGFLEGVQAGGSIVLRNAAGPSWIEYNHGAGRVIVTTLDYCMPSTPASIGAPLANLLRYAPFFNGLAQTPGLTATPTTTPTPTETGLATVTPTNTPVTPTVPATPPTPVTPPTESPTATATEVPTNTPIAGSCAGDCDGNGITSINELIRAVNIALALQPVSACTAADLNDDGLVSINELISAVRAALEGCPLG